MYRAMLLMLNN